jgi:hypothetical protein
MSSLVYGSHTEQAYSSDGRTKDLYACSLTLVVLMLVFLRRNPSVLLAFVVMLFIWLSPGGVAPPPKPHPLKVEKI